MPIQKQVFTGLPESPFAAMRRWARGQTRHLFLVMAVAGILGAAAVIVIDEAQMIFCAPMISLASLGGWGLLLKRNQTRASRADRLLSALLAGVGGLALLIAVFGLLFWAMGPAPIL
jgi:hypothetical protein